MLGRAAERPLSVHLQWVEQLVALGLQGTAHLQGGRAHRAGAVVDQLRGREIVVSLKRFCKGVKKKATPRRLGGPSAQHPAPPSGSDWDSSWEEERRLCLGGKHYKHRQKISTEFSLSADWQFTDTCDSSKSSEHTNL